MVVIRARQQRNWCATVLVALTLSTLCSAGEENTALYPRKLGEVKAMMTILAPDRTAKNARDQYLARIAQHRYVCGLAYDVQWDDEQAKLAKAAAGICAKLGKLTHHPERPAGMSDAEYEPAKKGAGESNLFKGRTHPIGCVDGWMDDSDPTNIDRVGHRRWILNPKMGKSAFGAMGDCAAMYAFDGSRKDVPDWDFCAYPARGYQPIELFGARHAWSVSPNMAKYKVGAKEQIKVTLQPLDAKLQPAGAALSFDYFNVETGGYGSGPAIIFRPAGLSLTADARYRVDISGLQTKSGDAAPISFLVHFVDLKKVPDSPDSRATYSRYFSERLSAAQASTDEVAKLEQIAQIAEDKFLTSAEPAVGAAVKNALQALLKQAPLRREYEAAQRYRTISEAEQKAGTKKDQLLGAAAGYRDLAAAYKETRAGQRAAEDFERLKKSFQ